jgi:hypothetical protein
MKYQFTARTQLACAHKSTVTMLLLTAFCVGYYNVIIWNNPGPKNTKRKFVLYHCNVKLTVIVLVSYFLVHRHLA